MNKEKITPDEILAFLQEKRIQCEGIEAEDISAMIKGAGKAVVLLVTERSLMGVEFSEGKFVTCLNREEIIRVSKALKPVAESGRLVDQVTQVGQA